jgi:hypothetical protein
MPVQTVDEGLYGEDLSRKDQLQLLASMALGPPSLGAYSVR